MAKEYRKKVNSLREALNQEDQRKEATEILRSLVAKVVLTPKPGSNDWSIVLYGDLAEILQIASASTGQPGNDGQSADFLGALEQRATDKSVALVAGAGCQRYLLTTDAA